MMDDEADEEPAGGGSRGGGPNPEKKTQEGWGANSGSDAKAEPSKGGGGGDDDDAKDDDDRRGGGGEARGGMGGYGDDDGDEILIIPDLEEEAEEDITAVVAEAPRNLTRRLPSLRELDAKLKTAAPSGMGVDLSVRPQSVARSSIARRAARRLSAPRVLLPRSLSLSRALTLCRACVCAMFSLTLLCRAVDRQRDDGRFFSRRRRRALRARESALGLLLGPPPPPLTTFRCGRASRRPRPRPRPCVALTLAPCAALDASAAVRTLVGAHGDARAAEHGDRGGRDVGVRAPAAGGEVPHEGGGGAGKRSERRPTSGGPRGRGCVCAGVCRTSGKPTVVGSGGGVMALSPRAPHAPTLRRRPSHGPSRASLSSARKRSPRVGGRLP